VVVLTGGKNRPDISTSFSQTEDCILLLPLVSLIFPRVQIETDELRPCKYVDMRYFQAAGTA
jgi:hypothetical protein